jgi:hypothetical protein
MPQTPHAEKHFTAGDAVRDVVIGMSDGLTVPFALAAGLTGAVTQSRLIVTAGFAEIAAGSIAMGLGGYLAARGDAEHYRNELAREAREIKDLPEVEAQEVRDILRSYGLEPEESESLVASLRRRPAAWISSLRSRVAPGAARPRSAGPTSPGAWSRSAPTCCWPTPPSRCRCRSPSRWRRWRCSAP